MRGSARLRGIFIASAFSVLSLALLGASCDKKSVAEPANPDPGPPAPFEAPPKPSDAKPTPVKTPETPPADRLGALADKLPSPCGKAHSLRKSLEGDPACKRAPFAKK